MQSPARPSRGAAPRGSPVNGPIADGPAIERGHHGFQECRPIGARERLGRVHDRGDLLIGEGER